MDFANLRNFMDGMSRTHSPGCAAEVYLGGERVFRYACGYSNLENRIPMTGEELFNIYSCSKVTTAVAGMQLLERGVFLLSDPLYEYIPEFRHMTVRNGDGTVRAAENPITMGDLFTMTAGFGYDLEAPGFRRAKEVTGGKMDTLETIRCVAEDPLDFEPGTRFQYSICHDVLAAAISAMTGKKFRDYVKEEILEPLQMEDTRYHHTAETLERTARQYCFVPDRGEEKDPVEAQKSGCTGSGTFRNVGKGVSHILGEEYDSGGAGIITTVSDYARLTAALANYGTGLTGQRILSPYAVNLMRTNRLSGQLLEDFSWPQLRGCSYGLGVRTHMDPVRSGVIASLGEFGWGGAAGATVIVDPELNLGVFFAQHTLNPREEYYQPRLRNAVYSCLD